IFISNPNNPTGNCFNESTLLKIISAASGLVVIDEAYFNFSKTTLLKHIQRHKNLIILRTLSKIGLAGLRIGILISNEQLCSEIGKVRLPYNTNSISQAIAEIVLNRDFEINKQIDKIISDRETLFMELAKIEEITPFKSKANFILFKSDFPAEDLFEGLLSKGILVRHFGKKGALKDCLRVTVGTGLENGGFLEGLRDFIHAKESGKEL
ncbi:MAG: pyridoxal phosphate-dependent aminotransferase, partial [Nitrospinota bacterium]